MNATGAWLRRASFAVGLAGALASPGGALPAQTTPRAVRPRTTYEDLQLLSGVLNQIKANHPDSVDMHELLMSAIQGLVQAADPHSYFITAVRFNTEKEKAWRDGKLYPVGIDFAFANASPVVVGVRPGSSAARADILIGDELVAVDGKPVDAQSAFELDVALAGDRNSSVQLTLERERLDGSLVQLERTVKREKLDEQTAVPTAFMLDPQTGYVRITSFMNERVADDVHDALGRLEKSGMKRLVLDLRDNGGGLVSEAKKVAGEFLPKGTLIYTQEGRKAEIAKDTGRVERSFWSREKRYPIVLLVNSGTASASELVAGALQDHDRALIVGRPSFGKSLLMEPFLLPDGSVFEMVVGHVKTPCGRVIQRQYRGLSAHEYRRRAGDDRIDTSRPSCRTDGGRTVYGGGGIYPDVMLPRRDRPPVWLARLDEDALFLRWIGGYVTAHGASFPSLDSLVAHPIAPPAAIADFRTFAAQQGANVPAGAEADSLIGRRILSGLADAKWGDAGAYRIMAVLDSEVASAVAAFDKASAILAAAK